MKVLMILVSLMFMGCALDEEYQREYFSQWDTEEVEEILDVIYIDCEGNIITDPDIIDEIKSKFNI